MLGDTIKKIRKEKGMSQDDLAEILGVSRQSISLWETNQTQPSVDKIILFAKEFNISTDDLLIGAETANHIESEQSKLKINKKRKTVVILGIIAVVIVLITVCIFVWLDHNNNITGNDASDNTIIENERVIEKFSEDSESIEKASESVVKIYCYNANNNEIATGSGFVMFRNDLIVTNYHVISDAYAAKISTEQDFSYEIDGIWYSDIKKDIAILKTKKATGLSLLVAGNPDTLKKGDTVTAIGSPLGIKNTVSEGNLSGRVSNGKYDELQFTAAISNGSSGGALFNEFGEVVGITYASFLEGQNLNLAIPINLVEKLYNERKLVDDIESLEDIYWNNHPEEYAIYNKMDPINVTFDELKNNPSIYDGKTVVFEATISSVSMIQELRMGIYVSDGSYVSNNENEDSKKVLNEVYSECCLLNIYTHKTIDNNLIIESGDKVIITGEFSFWKKGEPWNDDVRKSDGANLTAVEIQVIG